MKDAEYQRIREFISRCQWTYAKTMPWAPHEYIVRGKCPLTDEEFLYFIDAQRKHGIYEIWGRYNLPYLYIDDYKYWTMGDTYENTTIINRAKVSVLDDAINLCKEIERIREQVKANAPYHFNALLDASPMETGVSKIIAGFFKQRIDNRFFVLESFIRRFFGDSLASKINKPIIEAEKEVKDQKRIDILIYEKGEYAIVFENKIWDAVEQPNQLSNYIRGLKEPEYGFGDEQIYIVYLPSSEEHVPTEVSWDKKLAGRFAERYRCISFKEDILDWLMSQEIQGIKGEHFSYSTFLFIDFLKRVFNLTDTDNMEQKEIQKHIHQRLELSGDNIHDINILNSKIQNISECVNQLERMRKELSCKIMREWSANLSSDFPNLKKVEDIRPIKYIKTGVTLPCNGIEDAIHVLVEIQDKRVIYGVLYMPDTKKIRKDMQETELIRPFYESGEFIKGVDWLFYKDTSLEDGYLCLKQLIERLLVK